MNIIDNDTTAEGQHQMGAHALTVRKQNAANVRRLGANVTVIAYGERRPRHRWTAWQTEPQTDAEFEALPWDRAGAFGIVNGFGGWRCLDLDADKGGGANPVPKETVLTLLAAMGLPPDYRWVERSQSGNGWHVWIRCPDDFPEGFTARAEGKKGIFVGESRDGSFKQLELRWSDHQTVVSASIDKALWAHGLPQAPPATVEVDKVIAAFLAVARPKQPQEAPTRVEGRGTNTDLPGDDFNARGDVAALLERHGWRCLGTHAVEGREVSDWRRPGSTGDHAHATYGRFPGVFYVFSPNCAPFEMNKGYSAFAVYTLLNHGGDFKAAATALRQEGYGKQPAPALVKSRRHTQVAYAERLTHLYGDRIRYVDDYKRWAVYDDSRWNLDTSGDSVWLQGLTKNTLDETYEAARLIKENTLEETNQKQDEFRKEVLKKANQNQIGGIISLARSEPGIRVTPDDLDADPYLFNVRNGTLNLETGELRPHDPADLITKLAPADYDPDAECPRWLSFLNRIMDGDTELVGYLQRLAGYAMAGTGRDQSLSIFYGSGANGKSTFLETVAAMLGDYWTKTPTQTLMQRNRGGIPNDLAALKGARFVTANEIPAGGKLDVATVKDLTGEDTITARFLYGELFSFRPVFTLVIYGNHKPQIDGDDYGIWRRVHLVPFTVQIPEHERDSRLREKLINQEAPGILNWMLAGFQAWNKEGLNPPESILAATEEYREEMDSVSQFIGQCFDFVANGELRTSEIMEVYDAWYEAEEGEWRGARKSRTAIGEALTKRGIGTRRSGGIFRTGIQLSEEGQRLRHAAGRLSLSRGN